MFKYQEKWDIIHGTAQWTYNKDTNKRAASRPPL